MVFRKAATSDLDAIEGIYQAIHDQEEQGQCITGWLRNIYPTRQTAHAALARGDLFVLDDHGVKGAAIINQQQVDVYEGAPWQHSAPDEEVMVLHTLTISPAHGGKGYGKAFVQFYEGYALQNGCRALRMDTNARNLRARAMYQRLGYHEIAIVPCVFNGIEGVQLVLLEKAL